MEAHKNKMNLLVTKINRMEEENQKLNSMLKRMISNYEDLQKQIRYQEKDHLTRVDRSQIFSPEHQIDQANFNFGILCPRSVHIDSSGAVSHQSSDSHERAREKDGKNTRCMDDQLLSSNKRKISQLQLDQFQNGMINSSMDESPNKKHQVLSNGSGEQMATAPKRIVSLRTRSEASVVSDGCHWRKYGQKSTRNNTYPRSYYRCGMAPSCPVKKQVQRCAEDPTIVITTYEGEHTHSLSPLAMAVMQASSSNQLISEALNTVNFNEDNQFIPCIATISTSSPFPTITLDLTDNLPCNSGLQLQPPHLPAGSLQHLPPASNDISQALDQNQSGHSSVMDSVSVSTTADQNFTAALAVAIAGSMLNLCAPVQGMPDFRHGTQCSDGSSQEAFV